VEAIAVSGVGNFRPVFFTIHAAGTHLCNPRQGPPLLYLLKWGSGVFSKRKAKSERWVFYNFLQRCVPFSRDSLFSGGRGAEVANVEVFRTNYGVFPTNFTALVTQDAVSWTQDAVSWSNFGALWPQDDSSRPNFGAFWPQDDVFWSKFSLFLVNNEAKWPNFSVYLRNIRDKVEYRRTIVDNWRCILSSGWCIVNSGYNIKSNRDIITADV
jgi:hypothetical protein